MKKKNLLALLLALCLCFALAACGGKSNDDSSSSDNGGASDAGNSDNAGAEDDAEDNDAEDNDGENTESDLAYVQDKGTLIVGITEFEPMDYQDADGKWIGFDADMATAFAESLGVDVVFQLIADWDNKIMELDGKTVDVVWNGMTLTDEVLSGMECSNAYVSNTQVAVVPADKADDYQTVESLADLQFAVENGSAGQEVLEDLGYSYTPVDDQAGTLLEVSSGTADAAVIDYLMALAMTGEGTSYDNLTYTVLLNEEEYGVGFRKGSDLAEKLNEFFDEQYANGAMQELAEQYGIADNLIARGQSTPSQ